MNKKILYLTYDGLTDPLGQSQILPYLKGLARHGYRFTILSFEKRDRFEKEKELVEKLTAESGITWVPLPFTSKPPFLSKFYDAVQMRRKAEALHRQHRFDMVHCRSYISADVGLYLKKKFGVKFFFDMRGFWADEKKDGSWNVKNPVYRRIYQYYKQKETQYLQHADYIISLTEAGKAEMMRWPSFNARVPLDVIPCCADMDHFTLTDAAQKAEARRSLGLPAGSLVISYLGSVGTWYMTDEMLLFFRQLKQEYPGARFLFITHTPAQQVLTVIEKLGLSPADFLIRSATRREVPFLVKASDLNISFIRPVYSKISSSPTKLGEVLSMGIPVICNRGVGDVEAIVQQAGAGFVVGAFTEADFREAIRAIPGLLQKDPATIRRNAEAVYSLTKGIELYLRSYRSVFRDPQPEQPAPAI
ncbi:MAG TPA: glycosyltransferase [Chitinophagaceae bacterium]|jgi:glycosyltransferase involved in cell wall biosynthesis|nr:glycosyltransferase [Chitinophagaceae bacterium]